MLNIRDVFRQTFFKYLFGICILFVIFSSLSFYEGFSEEKSDLAGIRSRVAVVYANPTFHDEVVSVISCILHDLGFYVVVYIGNGVHLFGGRVLVPFTGKRKSSSSEFYGRCVSQWVTIGSPVKYVTNPDVMVFVTYPMSQHGGAPDEYALSLLRKLKQDKSDAAVVMVTHRTNEFIHEMMATVETLIPRNQTTYMFLGEHTWKDARRIAGIYDEAVVAQAKGNVSLGLHSTGKYSGILKQIPGLTIRNPSTLNIAHIYPVLPMDYVIDPPGVPPSVRPSLFSLVSSLLHPLKTGYHPLFAMQGNFGGKHAHRKDPKGTVECLRRVEDKALNGILSMKHGYSVPGYGDGLSGSKGGEPGPSYSKGADISVYAPGKTTTRVQEETVGKKSAERGSNKHGGRRSSSGGRNLRRDNYSETTIMRSPSESSRALVESEQPDGSHSGTTRGSTSRLAQSAAAIASAAAAVLASSHSMFSKHLGKDNTQSTTANTDSRSSGVGSSSNKASTTEAAAVGNRDDGNISGVGGGLRVANGSRVMIGSGSVSSTQLQRNSTSSTSNNAAFLRSSSASASNAGGTSSSSTGGGVHVSIDLIGHLDGKVEVGTLKTGDVRFLSDLRSREYYKAISQAHFMLAAIGEREYFTSRATSSVPAALISHVPLVTSGEFLAVYPCLRDAPIHRLIAGWEPGATVGASDSITGSKGGKSNRNNHGQGSGGKGGNKEGKQGHRSLSSLSSSPATATNNTTTTSQLDHRPAAAAAHNNGRYRSECEAMEVAMQLSDAQYEAARAEIAHCSQLLWEQAKQTFNQVLARSGSGSSSASSRRQGNNKATHALTGG